MTVLCQRIHDPETRAWAVRRIHEDDIHRHAIPVRPGVSEDSLFQAWRVEVDADAEVAAAAASAEGVADLERVTLAPEPIGRDPFPRIRSNDLTNVLPRSWRTSPRREL